ncbi:MAG: class I tRNA ligase family protein [Candidatus Yonathbacteria bacterium]|nr:class I tRNA ligase family protein [Candidatus Yonathbacteria bacterium]
MTDSLENKKPTRSEREREILAFWNEKKIFEKTLKKTKGKKTFVFYDGPPFATGTPHYGHILTSFMKDAIPRYRTMKGNFVRRVWGWDCHGLPLENVVEKELGLEHKKDIEKFGIEKFNETAKVSVLRYDADWKKMIPRIGRWVDMEHSYKTMDASYSESIWWAFKTLYDKKLIYKGFKSMHICPRCETTLSNNEVADEYKDITDISVTVKFEPVDPIRTGGSKEPTSNGASEPKTYILAWTTTPWTLPGNVALAINDDIVYVKIKKSKLKNQNDSAKLKDNEYYILAKDRLSEVLNGEEYETIGEFKGKDLVGKTYKPLFDYYANNPKLPNRENGWKVYSASFVTTESGTGVVHIAPAFGEDDLKLGEKYDLPFVQHVRMDGTFASEVKDFAGMPVKPKSDDEKTRLSADIAVIRYLQEHDTFFDKQKITHSYPHCWRCETPLLNYASSSWFVKVTAIKKKLLAENNKVKWVPETMKHGRFGKWLHGARDWAISRSRFWGAPLPVWECSSCKKIHVIGSIKELQDNMKASGNRYIVMRHGEAESNVRNITSTDVRNHSHLTDRGIRQAMTAGKKLKKQKIDVVYSSDFARTHETAELVAKEIGIAKELIRFDPRLREINTGMFNNKSNAEYHAFYASNEERFYKAPEGGENLSEVKRRVMDFLYEIEQKHRGETILIVTHEYPSWMFAAGACGALAKDAALMKPEGRHFLETAQYLALPFTPLPHNSEYELDLHRPYIDNIKLPCLCGGEMKRIPDVFDCWFESGSMPYAQFHYPFENKKEFEKNFPADFIAEGLDQTRGWFYNMLVLSVGLFGKTPFKNVIVNGLILAEDGQKMSKRLKNYPDPADIVLKYGADALRYYLLSSPIMHGEDLKFSEKGVDEVQKKVIGRLLNVLSFYELYADPSVKASKTSKHVLDRWILTRLNELSIAIETALGHYELDGATRPIGEFVDDLSTWYLRRSRDRFKSDILSDKKAALATTRFVLLEFTKIIAPIMPFIAEELYQKVKEKKGAESVHLENWPQGNKPTALSKRDVLNMTETKAIASLGLEARAQAGIKVRQPLASLKIKNQKSKIKNNKELLQLIKDELNVKAILFDARSASEVEIDATITPELKKEGQFRELVRNIQDLRKKEGLSTKDRAVLEVQTDNNGEDLIKSFVRDIKRICLLKDITFAQTLVGEGIKIDNLEFIVSLKK